MLLGRQPCALSCARLRRSCAEDAVSKPYFQPFATVLPWPASQPRQLTEYQNESAYSKSRTSLVIGFIKMFKVEATCPAVTSSPLPTTLLSITLEPALTTSLEHSLRSPLRALARDRKGVRFLSDQAFANHPPSIIKRTHQKEQRSCRHIIYKLIWAQSMYVLAYMHS